MAKVILLNGSPRANGCTATALEEMVKVFTEEGIESEIINVGSHDIRGCISCNKCAELGRCVFDDLVNETAEKFKEADGLVIGSPVYYGSPNGTILAFMDRLFYSTPSSYKFMKPGASVVSCRRGGNTASFDALNKYFTISGMPLASSTYWNQVHGFTAEDVKNAQPRKEHVLHDQSLCRPKGKDRPARFRARRLHQLPRRQINNER